ncbi:hypothetical protein, partial [endosymbiont of Lamellibrachia barhami]|uniref:hypothetical protein n=1 Tax=endosymbiont of Lamellibrachia barhami TaxID=205975 RepID=UPI001C4B2F27
VYFVQLRIAHKQTEQGCGAQQYHFKGEERSIQVFAVHGNRCSDRWIISHLRPMSESNRVGRIYMVAATKLPEIDKVTPIYPNARLQKRLCVALIAA